MAKPKPNILIAGGSGMIGQFLVEYFSNKGYKVAILGRKTRKGHFQWTIADREETCTIEPKAIEFCDVLINLAGANLGAKRWTLTYKRQLINSRILSAKTLYNSFLAQNKKPRLYIAASATGYYGYGDNNQKKENDFAGKDFLARLCVAWEQENLRFKELCPTYISRIGIVCQKNKSFLKELSRLQKMRILPILGSGTQICSYIHIADIAHCFEEMILGNLTPKIYNLCTPTPMRLGNIIEEIERVNHKKYFKPKVPAWLLKILVGEFSTYLTTGNNVKPQHLLDNNFQFQYANFHEIVNSFGIDKNS